MRVLVDATAIPADRGGVGRYVDELVAALGRQGVDLVVAVQARDVAGMSARSPGARVVPAARRTLGRAARLAWEQVRLPGLLRRERADVLLSPHYTMPVRAGVPVVVTLHDATFFSHPQVHSGLKGRFFRTATRVAVRRAAALVVPSAATRDEVLRHVGGDPARFHVAHHGVDTARFHPVPPQEVVRVRAALGLGDRPYVAFLGTLEPRKNVPALVRGWVEASRDRSQPPALLLAGAPGWDEEVDPALAAVPEHLDARRLGYLPFEDLAPFLSGAEVVAYPALGEGFGLPVLEAMACGAAVLTTRELSLPEVGGDAVAYCGTDAASIATVLGDLLDDRPRRADLARRGVERAAGFTWDAAAAVHVAAFEQALVQARRPAR